ncbi:MAG: hypothetical protein OXC37_01180 [Bdellovibrionaceae bacterium]|nr:hypothetical protein [Pseudobdellovibrionaceae bacterium]
MFLRFFISVLSLGFITSFSLYVSDSKAQNEPQININLDISTLSERCRNFII